jgi:hypothetical protein
VHPVMPLANLAFLAMIDDTTGQPRTEPHVRALVLAAALLIEQIHHGVIAVEDKRVALLPGQTRLTDELDHYVAHHLRRDAAPAGAHARRPTTVTAVTDWLTVLASYATDRVADRVTAAGHLHPTRHRVTRRVRYTNEDLNFAYAPIGRIASAVQHNTPLDQPDVELFALLNIANLTLLIREDLAVKGITDAQVDAWVQALPAWLGPSIREVVEVTATVLAARGLIGTS